MRPTLHSMACSMHGWAAACIHNAYLQLSGGSVEQGSCHKSTHHVLMCRYVWLGYTVCLCNCICMWLGYTVCLWTCRMGCAYIVGVV